MCIEEKINKMAHSNCIDKLNVANSRIVEFERIKKEHLEYVDALKARIEALENFVADLQRGPEGGGVLCFLHSYVKTSGDRYKLWADLHLKKYPENY